MAFDEQLGRAFETISGLIRAEVSRQVHAVTDELAAARMAYAARDSDALAVRLAEGVRAIGAARSLHEVIDALVTSAALEASRTAFLIVRGERFHSWRFIGFGAALDATDSLDISRDEAGVIAHAADTASIAFGGAEAGPRPPAFAQLSARRRCLALPLTIDRRPVAVLYADGGGAGQPEAGARRSESNAETGTLNAEALEVLARYAARTLEAFTAIHAARSPALGSGQRIAGEADTR